VTLRRRLRGSADRCGEATHHYGSHEERPSTSRAESESWDGFVRDILPPSIRTRTGIR
jgi:hypothetical protein